MRKFYAHSIEPFDIIAFTKKHERDDWVKGTGALAISREKAVRLCPKDTVGTIPNPKNYHYIRYCRMFGTSHNIIVEGKFRHDKVKYIPKKDGANECRSTASCE